MPTIENQITQIETKLAYMEDFMNKLQGLAVEHSGEIDRLKLENRAFREKIIELSDAMQDLPNRRPPHY